MGMADEIIISISFIILELKCQKQDLLFTSHGNRRICQTELDSKQRDRVQEKANERRTIHRLDRRYSHGLYTFEVVLKCKISKKLAELSNSYFST